MSDEPQMMVHTHYGKLFRDHPDCPKSVPMRLLNEQWAQRNHGQSLEILNRRGGLCPTELMANIEKRQLQSMPLALAIRQLKEAIK